MGEGTGQRRTTGWRRGAVFFAGFAAAMLGAVSVAWACTAQMSPLKICEYDGTVSCNDPLNPTNATYVKAQPGTKMTATNKGYTPALAPSTYYALKFNNAYRVRNLQSCHSIYATYTMKSNILTDAAGTFSVTAYLPSSYTSAPKGVSEMCAVQTSAPAGATATQHARLTII